MILKLNEEVELSVLIGSDEILMVEADLYQLAWLRIPQLFNLELNFLNLHILTLNFKFDSILAGTENYSKWMV